MSYHYDLTHVFLRALMLPLTGSIVAGVFSSFLLSQAVLTGTANAAAWASVALSVVSMVGVIARIIASDRQSNRQFDAELQRMRTETLALHVKDAQQQRQIEALGNENRKLRGAVKSNTSDIDVLVKRSESGFTPKYTPDVAPGSTTTGPAPGAAGPGTDPPQGNAP